MQAWKENIKSRVEKCSGFLPFHWAPEWNYEKQTPPKALAPHLHNHFFIIQDNKGRGNRKASNPGNTGTQQYQWAAPALPDLGRHLCVHFPKFLRLWELFVLSKKLKQNRAGYSLLKYKRGCTKALQGNGVRESTKNYTGIWLSGQTHHGTVQTTLGKCKTDPGSLMTPAAIHGKGTRDWDVPLLCKRTGCSSLAVGEVQLHFLCSGLCLVGEEQGCDSLWAGKEWGRDVPQQAQGKDCLS